MDGAEFGERRRPVPLDAGDRLAHILAEGLDLRPLHTGAGFRETHIRSVL